jgi:hypothetical protein
VCGAELLNRHELTGLCNECKLLLRNDSDSFSRCHECGQIPADGDPRLCRFCTNWARAQKVAERLRELS